MLKQLKIGDITIKNPIILAPMCGVTDYAYRKIVNKFGAGYTVSEMIASRAALMDLDNAKQKAMQSDGVTAIQIAGFEPEVMAEVAKKIQDGGADIIDINFGCPVKKVVNGMAGSALMKHEDLAGEIMMAVCKAVQIPVTVKMRMGWDVQSLNAPKIAQIAESVGVKMITIHGRTRSQLYDGKADWGFIQNVVNAVKIPVIANGDIKTIDDVKNALDLSGANGVMIGRASYGKPWLVSQLISLANGEKPCQDPTSMEKLELILEQLEYIEEIYGPIKGCGFARKHLSWYCQGMSGAGDYRGKVNQENDFGNVKKMTIEFYKNNW